MAAFLTKSQEHALAEAWRNDGDEAAMHRLVAAHLPLARKAAKGYSRYGYDFEDVFSAACVGMMDAAVKFDTAHGARFSTYALLWIKAAIQDYIRRNHSIVRGSLAREGKQTRLADLRRYDLSLDKPISEDGSATFGDTLAAPEVDVDAVLDLDRRTQWLMEAVAELPDRERFIVSSRHLNDADATLEDLGTHLGISKERVRQIETRAIGHLTTAVKKKNAPTSSREGMRT